MQLATTKGSLCQPEERREGVWQLGREEGGYYQVSSASVHWFGAGRGGGGTEPEEGNENRGDRFAGWRMFFGTMTLVSSSLSLSGVFVGGLWGEGDSEG